MPIRYDVVLGFDGAISMCGDKATLSISHAFSDGVVYFCPVRFHCAARLMPSWVSTMASSMAALASDIGLIPSRGILGFSKGTNDVDAWLSWSDSMRGLLLGSTGGARRRIWMGAVPMNNFVEVVNAIRERMPRVEARIIVPRRPSDVVIDKRSFFTIRGTQFLL